MLKEKEVGVQMRNSRLRDDEAEDRKNLICIQKPLLLRYAMNRVKILYFLSYAFRTSYNDLHFAYRRTVTGQLAQMPYTFFIWFELSILFSCYLFALFFFQMTLYCFFIETKLSFYCKIFRFQLSNPFQSFLQFLIDLLSVQACNTESYPVETLILEKYSRNNA